MLFISDRYLPKPSAQSFFPEARVDKSIIRIKSAHKWPEPIVFDTSLLTIVPPLLPVLIASFAFNFNNFSVIYLLTGGGPRMVGGGDAGETDILVSYTYSLAFRSAENNYALASAIATLLFFLVGTLAWTNLRMSSRRITF